MTDDIPLERLRFFRHELAITPEAATTIAPYRAAFVARREAMATALYADIAKIAQTKIVLEHETSPTRLQGNWQRWYATLWGEPLGDELLTAVWQSGRAHVSHGVDHRFITLAYAHARRYTHGLVEELVPGSERGGVHNALDRLIDLCTLVETDAYLAANARCSLEVMMGIAHQMRNPLMVIGGFARRMLRSAGEHCDNGHGPETIMDEAQRLERMVKDVGIYVNILRAEPAFSRVPLAAAVAESLARLSGQGWPGRAEVLRDIAPEAAVQADPELLAPLLDQVLVNAFEAAAGEPPRVGLATAPAPEGFVCLAVANTGQSPRKDEIAGYFEPFSSTKPMGTGFGLAIAQLGARKCFGAVTLEPAADGALCRVTLPAPGSVHASGLYSAAQGGAPHGG